VPKRPSKGPEPQRTVALRRAVDRPAEEPRSAAAVQDEGAKKRREVALKAAKLRWQER